MHTAHTNQVEHNSLFVPWPCRKHPNGEASQLQIILCAKDPPAALFRLGQAGDSMQQASHTMANASTTLRGTDVQARPSAELKPARNNYAECQLAASSALEGLLVRSAEESMVTQNLCSRPHAADDTQQERYASTLPDKVAAFVKQHQLKLETVQVEYQSKLAPSYIGICKLQL